LKRMLNQHLHEPSVKVVGCAALFSGSMNSAYDDNQYDCDQSAPLLISDMPTMHCSLAAEACQKRTLLFLSEGLSFNA
jgi:hypothetical protein